MLKLLYFSTAIVPSSYANSVNVMKMCNALSVIGTEVTLTVTEGVSQNDVYNYYGIKNKFKIIRMKNGKMRFLSRIIVLLKEAYHNDVIYTRYTLAAFITALILRKFVIYEYHAPAYKKIYTFLESILSKSNNVLHVFITEALENYYLNKYENIKSKYRIVLPDGADKIFSSLPERQREIINCGYVGSFIQGKGIDTIIEIANRLPDIKFHVVGGKKEEIKNLKELNNANNIIWYGQLSQADAMKVLEDKIDIALLPNHKNIIVEGKFDIGKWTSPIKLFEYMSYGKAIIASDIPVLHEIIHDNQNVLLANPEDPQSWVVAITYLINNPKELDRIRKNAFDTFSQLYSWEKRAEKLINKLDKLFS